MESPAVVPGIMAIGLVVAILVCSVVGVLLTVIPFWKICTKVGFPGPLSLLMEEGH